MFFDNLRFLAMMNVNGGGVPWSCHGDRSVASVCRCRCPVLWHAGTDTFWQVWLPSLTCREGALGGVVTHCPLVDYLSFLSLFPNHPKSFLVLRKDFVTPSQGPPPQPEVEGCNSSIEREQRESEFSLPSVRRIERSSTAPTRRSFTKVPLP